MRKQYYTLQDMYRLKGGFLKNTSLLSTFEKQKEVFEKYTGVEEYEFLLQLPYYGTFTGAGGIPVSADDGLEQIIRDKIEEHFNKNTLECLSRIEYTKTQLPTFVTTKLLQEKDGAETRLRAEMDNAEEEVNYATSNLADKVRMMLNLCADKEAMERAKELAPSESSLEMAIRVNQSLASITRTGLWDFVSSWNLQMDTLRNDLANQRYCFVSKDITMTNPKGVAVNFGKFRLMIGIYAGTPMLRIRPFRNNIESPHIHPNISSQGHICWGNMSDKAEVMLGKLNISGAVDILNTILTRYTPTSPYRRFNAFVRDDNKGNRSTLCGDGLEGRNNLYLDETSYPRINVRFNEPVTKYLFPKLVEPEESQSINEEEANAD